MRIFLFFCIGVWLQAQPSERHLTTLEKVQVMEAALIAPEGGLPFMEEWDEILEDARNSGNWELEVRARSVVAALRVKQRRTPPSLTREYLEEAWRRETERRSRTFTQDVAGVGSMIGVGLFVVGTTAASGGMVLSEYFWNEFTLAPPGSERSKTAYARTGLAQAVSIYGAWTTITGAAVFVVFELIKAWE